MTTVCARMPPASAHGCRPATAGPSQWGPSAREVAHEDGDKAEKDQTNHQSDHGDAERGRARTQEEQQNQSDRSNVERHAKGRPAQVWAHRATSGVLEGPAGVAPAARVAIVPARSRATTWQAVARRSPTTTSSGRTTSHNPSSKSGQRG